MNPAAAEMPHSWVTQVESVSIVTLAETLHGLSGVASAARLPN